MDRPIETLGRDELIKAIVNLRLEREQYVSRIKTLEDRLAAIKELAR